MSIVDMYDQIRPCSNTAKCEGTFGCEECGGLPQYQGAAMRLHGVCADVAGELRAYCDAWHDVLPCRRRRAQRDNVVGSWKSWKRRYASWTPSSAANTHQQVHRHSQLPAGFFLSASLSISCFNDSDKVRLPVATVRNDVLKAPCGCLGGVRQRAKKRRTAGEANDSSVVEDAEEQNGGGEPQHDRRSKRRR